MNDEDQHNRQNIIRYLRGLIDNLESGKARLIEFSQEIDMYDRITESAIIENVPTGGRIEVIHWVPQSWSLAND